MAKEILPQDLWEAIAPLLPADPPRARRGRPRVANRAVLTGILFVLRSGIPWEMLPHELGCGCGMTCWRRVRDWQHAGVWQQIHRVLLDRLGRQSGIDWSRCGIDGSMVPAPGGAMRRARIPRIGANRAPRGI